MTESKIKKIGVLTSGGDAPGMNAAIRAVVRTALSRNIKVFGIKHGYNGLINNDIQEMHLRSVSEIIHRGGTVLYTARSPEFITLQGQQTAAAHCREHGIQAVVVIGGDGSFRGAKDLSAQEVPCICIPGTIDNDIACTDYTIGYDTAMNTAVEMIDKLRDTTQSHERCSVVEVMGRNAGYIAVNTGLATGALVTLVPEKPFDVDKDIVDKMKFTRKIGKKHFIIIVAEGAGDSSALAKEIEEKTGIESRATVLGHVQRGGAPSLRDRVAASRLGYHAIDLLTQGITDRVIGFKSDDFVDYDIVEALAMHKEMDFSLLDISSTLSV
ncbi:6-phosphofructokinase [Ruminococcaceae bacterium OttesenSCG-928-A16]|nr:6-phosphofructokinase [Ruminococcaceae bacterium OttesenSCG-928-A16]